MTAVLPRDVAHLRPTDPPHRDKHVVVIRQRNVLAGIPAPLVLHRDLVGAGRHRKTSPPPADLAGPSWWAIACALLALLITVPAAWCRCHREQLVRLADDLELVVHVLWLLSVAALLLYVGWRSA